MDNKLEKISLDDLSCRTVRCRNDYFYGTESVKKLKELKKSVLYVVGQCTRVVSYRPRRADNCLNKSGPVCTVLGVGIRLDSFLKLQAVFILCYLKQSRRFIGLITMMKHLSARDLLGNGVDVPKFKTALDPALYLRRILSDTR